MKQIHTDKSTWSEFLAARILLILGFTTKTLLQELAAWTFWYLLFAPCSNRATCPGVGTFPRSHIYIYVYIHTYVYLYIISIDIYYIIIFYNISSRLGIMLSNDQWPSTVVFLPDLPALITNVARAMSAKMPHSLLSLGVWRVLTNPRERVGKTWFSLISLVFTDGECQQSSWGLFHILVEWCDEVHLDMTAYNI